MKNIEDKIIKGFVAIVLTILIIALLYGSIKCADYYFTKSNEQICKVSNSILINNTCHSERNFPVEDNKNMLLIGAIAGIVFVILLIFYMRIILKQRFKLP